MRLAEGIKMSAKRSLKFQSKSSWNLVSLIDIGFPRDIASLKLMSIAFLLQAGWMLVSNPTFFYDSQILDYVSTFQKVSSFHCESSRFRRKGEVVFNGKTLTYKEDREEKQNILLATEVAVSSMHFGFVLLRFISLRPIRLFQLLFYAQLL